MSSSRQLVAIMFTDIVGYTAQMDRDEVKAFELLKKNRLIQKPLIEQYNGKFLKEMGDGVLASFPTVTEAVNCARAIQAASSDEPDLVLRIGIHQGEVVFEGDDVFGSGVNIASRIEALADPGGILVSEAVYQNVKNQKDIRLEFSSEERLKNVDEPIKLYRITQQVGESPAQPIASPNISLWDELMDRNVLRAAIAYVVLAWLTVHTLDIVKNWLTLPTWVGGLVFVLLIIGFPVGIVLAWFYERSPEGFVRIGSRKSQKNPFSPRQKKPLTSNLIIAGLGLIIVLMYVFPQNKAKEDTLYGYDLSKSIDRSIAVLPFKNLSEEKGSQYFSDGVMDAILSNLSKMGELDVISRTSTEQYRDSPKSIPQIADELEVANILEGSVQRHGNQVRIIVQLINGPEDKHIWSENYDRELVDVFAVQSEIAEKIAQALQAELSPTEIESLGKIPTSDLSAYDLYLRGSENFVKYRLTDSLNYYEESVQFFSNAIEQDHNFAQAYAGLASAFATKNNRSEKLDNSWLDSAFTLSSKAISLDPNLSMGYEVRGRLFSNRNLVDEAINDLERAIQLDPNNSSAMIGLGWQYMRKREYSKTLVTMKKATKLDPGSPFWSRNFMMLGFLYHSLDDYQKAEEYISTPFQTGQESYYSSAYTNLSWIYKTRGDLDKSLEYSKKALSLDPEDDDRIMGHAESLYLVEEYEQSKILYDKAIARNDERDRDDFNFRHRYAYVLWQLGEEEEAMKYFEEQIHYCKESLSMQNSYGTNQTALYDLAGIYSFLGETELALETLSKMEFFSMGLNNFVMVDPLYENIRDLPETRRILAKAREEKARIREEVSAVEDQEELDWLKSK